MKNAEAIPERPPHPGVILHAEMLQAGLGARDLADALKVPTSRISQILSGERSISADTASRLERFSARRRSAGWKIRTNTISGVLTKQRSSGM